MKWAGFRCARSHSGTLGSRVIVSRDSMGSKMASLFVALGGEIYSEKPSWINEILWVQESEYDLSFERCWKGVTKEEVERCCSARDESCFDLC